MNNGLRIIGGEWRGRRITAPAGLDTRPLPDRVRQSLFDWLGQRLDGLTVADCFSGSGSFALEALSRGAVSAHAIDNGTNAVACIRANGASLEAGPRLVIHATDALSAAAAIPECDRIFIDPPFPWFREQPEALAAVIAALGKRCVAGGWVLVRGERGTDLPVVKGLIEIERRAYGRSWISHLARR